MLLDLMYVVSQFITELPEVSVPQVIVKCSCLSYYLCYNRCYPPSEIRFQLLLVSCWLSVAGCQLPVASCWLLIVSYQFRKIENVHQSISLSLRNLNMQPATDNQQLTTDNRPLTTSHWQLNPLSFDSFAMGHKLSSPCNQSAWFISGAHWTIKSGEDNSGVIKLFFVCM